MNDIVEGEQSHILCRCVSFVPDRDRHLTFVCPPHFLPQIEVGVKSLELFRAPVADSQSVGRTLMRD